MKTKLLIAILAGVVALVGVGFYFIKEDLAKKQKEEEVRKFREQPFNMKELYEQADNFEKTEKNTEDKQ